MTGRREISMRVAVVDRVGKQLMPCTPAKARHLLKAGKAKPKWSKLGIFYVQLVYEVEQPRNQTLVVGIDPGSSYEGYSVVGATDTVLNIMAEAPKHVKKAVEVRRIMRRARRSRKCWRRPVRDNRLCHKVRLPPSTRSRWEAKLRIVAQLAEILPLTDAVVEDVKAEIYKGKAGQWALAFSPIQVGKEHLYYQLQRMGLNLHKCEGHDTADLRQRFRLYKTKQKDKPVFSSHCVDSWVLAASVSGVTRPTEQRLYYVKELRLHRRQLHRLQPEKGGVRKPYGGTRSLGLKRGTLVNHPKYGLCSVGGTLNGKVSLHAYANNKRLTQGAKVQECSVLTSTPYRTQLIPERSALLPLHA
jgi:hypothetical protein